MHTDIMKRKVAKVAPLRLSPNEEASILKQERERRRKIRLQQVREQERFIAQQIRQDVKERRDQQLQSLAEYLKAKWETEQEEKLRALEKVYLSALNSIGEGHRQAKENEPDVKAIERTAALNKEKAEKRHREALKELQQHREKLLREQTWHIKARRQALHIEKERAAKIASLPPPPPDPLENLEVVKKPPLVKLCNVDNFSISHYHLPEAYVDREMDTEQPDARVAAVQEEKRLDALQKEEEREKREQMETACLRGSYALKMVQLTQDRDRLIKELEQVQQQDFARRRQIVSKMPQQLFEPPYRRAEILEEWQRELESAFEDVYTKDTKMKGDMVLHLKPQPLPDPSVASIDEDLDLSVEPEAVSEMEHQPEGRKEVSSSDEPQENGEPQSRLVLRRLLNRIRTQHDQWSARSEAESATESLESGSLPLENVAQDYLQEEGKSDTQEATDTILAGKSILLHPQEQAAHVRLEADRIKRMEDLERQKMEQLELLKKLDEERQALEVEYSRVQLQMQEASRREKDQELAASLKEDTPEPAAPEPEVPSVPTLEVNVSAENLHIQMIREYQQRLIEQNKLHKQSVDEARKRLLEYQLLLKRRYPYLSTSNQESPERNLERARGGKSPKSETLTYMNNYDTGSPFGTMIGVRDPYTTPVLKHDSEQKHEALMPQTSRDLVPKETSPRTGDFLLQDGDVSSRLDQSIESLHATSSANGSVVESSPKERLPHSESLVQSRPEDKSRLPHVGDKLSSTSSPGEYETSSSTSYNPLPSELSLGLPHYELSEPAIPLSIAPIQEIGKDYPSLGDFSSVREFRERLLFSTAKIQVQQKHLKATQDLLDKQRDSLLSKQKSQEEHLLQKQRQLEEQIKWHKEALENVIGSREPEEKGPQSDFCSIPKKERQNFMSTLLEELEDSSQEDLQQEASNEWSSAVLIRPPGKEHRWRSSKPPVTKTKLGLFLEQHELSAIMEVETPTGGHHSSTELAESSAKLPGQSDVSRTNEAVFGHLETSRNGADTSARDLCGLLTRSLDQSCNDSRDQSFTKLSWKEMLSVDGSHDFTGTGQPSKIRTSIDGGEVDLSALSSSCMEQSVDRSHQKLSWREMLESSRHAGHTDLWRTSVTSDSPVDRGVPFNNPSVPLGTVHYGEATHGRSPNGIGEIFSTTISTGSFLTSEKTDSSPTNSDGMSELHRCNYSIIGEAQENSSSPSALENHNHIQKIIEKYTKDLSMSLEHSFSFHTPEAALDTSAGNHFPTTFYSLDPKPDFSASTSAFAFSNQTSSTLNSRRISQASQDTSYIEQQTPLSLQGVNDAMSSVASDMAQNVDFSRISPGAIGGPLAPGAFLDVSPADNRSPTTFYSLDPKLDFSLSITSSKQTSSSLYTKDVSKVLQNTNSREQLLHRSPWSASHSIADMKLSLEMAMSQNVELNGSSSRNLGEAADSSESFLPLHPEITHNYTNMSYQYETSGRNLTQRPDSVNADALHDGSQLSHVCSYGQNSIPIPTSLRCAPTTLAVQSVADESGSFHELMATKTTVNDSEISEHLIPFREEKNSRCIHFEELPVVHRDSPSHEDLGTTGCFPPDHKEPESSLSLRQESYSSTATEMDPFHRTMVSGSLTLESHSGSSSNLMSSLMTGSSAGSLPSCVHPWESGSARGILEEPDLTLLSLNDSSIVCSEPAVTRSTLSDDIQEDGSSLQSSFKPLTAEVDTLGVGQPDQSSFGGSLSLPFAEIDVKFTSTPGSLQEAFLKKKREFIEKSSKRILDIKTKERFPPMDLRSEPKDEYVAQVDHQSESDPVQADGSQLKRVVEVRVSTPEDRKLCEMEMHQRTVRLYNQLDEVKTRKEEKMRQEAYAKNREKAKEFKKRTLEKLRANKRK